MIENLTNWLGSFFNTFIEWLFNLMVDLFQLLIDGVCTAALSVVSLFPSGPSVPSLSPPAAGSVYSAVCGFIGWVLPVGYLASLIGFALSSIAAYFLIAPVARWFKLIT